MKLVAAIKAMPRNVKPRRESLPPSIIVRPKNHAAVAVGNSFVVSSGRSLLNPRFNKVVLPSDPFHYSEAAFYVPDCHSHLEAGMFDGIPIRTSRQQEGFVTPGVMIDPTCHTPFAPKCDHVFKEDDFAMPDHLMLPVL